MAKVVLINKDEIKAELALAGWMGAVSTDFEPDSENAYVNIAKHCIDSTHGVPTRGMRFIFEISEVSRVFSHEFVRHELGVIKVQRSQRFVSEDGFGYVTPDALLDIRCLVKVPIYSPDGALLTFVETWLSFNAYQDITSQMYKGFRTQGAKKEDARYVLSNATFTKLRVIANWEGMENGYSRRGCMRAQWEIRDVFELMKEEIEDAFPYLGQLLLAPCEKIGYCPEKKGCGRAPSREKFFNIYKMGMFYSEEGESC